MASRPPRPALGDASDVRLRCTASLAHSRCLGQVQRDVDDHVLLAADHPAPAQLDQDRAHVHAVLRRGRARRGAGSWSRPRRSPATASPGRPAPAGPAAGARGRRRRPSARTRRSRASSPCSSAAATNTSSGALPAPAPMPAERLASHAGSVAVLDGDDVLATPSDRLWWAWMPICVSRLQHLPVGVDALARRRASAARRRSR